MRVQQLNVQIKNRRDTATNWATTNPVLLAGEIGIESDTNYLKIGDGTTVWNSLAYFVAGISSSSGHLLLPDGSELWVE